MNILKPQKMLFSNLRKINDLVEEIKNDEKLENINIENYKKENIELTDITIEKAIINNVEFISSNLERNTFIDIEFSNCNFSNSSFNIGRLLLT